MSAERALPAAVQEFLDNDQRAQRCPPDPRYALAVLESVIENECEDALHAAAQGRWQKANTYAYDAGRKAVEAWLLANGWRIRSVAGAHAAVGEIVGRWLEPTDDPGPRMARSFGAARKARHDDEYPAPNAPERTAQELRALTLDSTRLVNRVREELGLKPTDDIIPTEAVLEERPER